MVSLPSLIDFKTRLSSIYDERECRNLYYFLLEKILDCDRTSLLIHGEDLMTIEIKEIFENITEKLGKGIPIQHIFGSSDFYKRNFIVNQNVLIPRPETESLVDWILNDQSSFGDGDLLDIGTGSGCIAISLKKEMKSEKMVWALDISEEALSVAQSNAQRLEADVHFIHDNILEPTLNYPCFSVIVSNPPYIRISEQPDIPKNVFKHDPDLALFVPDDDPLLFYRAIALFGQEHLINNGKLYFEINECLASETACLLRKIGYANIIIKKDDYGKNRMIRCQKNKFEMNTKDMSTPILSKETAYSKLATLCSKKEMCENQCRDKLKNWNINESDSEWVILKLNKEKFIDDKRFALFFARDKHRFAQWGRKKIELHLLQKKINPTFIDSALSEIPDLDCEEQLKMLLLQKIKTTKYKTIYELKGKLFRFALGRGFESDLALRCINVVMEKNKVKIENNFEDNSLSNIDIYNDK